MTIWKWLGFGPQDQEDDGGETETVRKIVAQLESLPKPEARHIAAFAYVLGRVAFADRDISSDETVMMKHLVERFGGLSEAQSVLVVEMAKQQAELFAGTENFLVTKEFAEISTDQQRRDLLNCLFAVAAADDSISQLEDNEIRKISTEIGLHHRDFVSIRALYSDKREVLKMLKKDGPD